MTRRTQVILDLAWAAVCALVTRMSGWRLEL